MPNKSVVLKPHRATKLCARQNHKQNSLDKLLTVISKERESQDLEIICGWTPSDSLRRPVSRKIFQRFLQNLRITLPQGKSVGGARLLAPATDMSAF